LSDEQFHQISFGHDEESYQDAQSKKDIQSDIAESDTGVAFEEIEDRGAFGQREREKE